ncbi:hypothetical protein Tco_0912533, partial [Tanacetum coccineum]
MIGDGDEEEVQEVRPMAGTERRRSVDIIHSLCITETPFFGDQEAVNGNATKEVRSKARN